MKIITQNQLQKKNGSLKIIFAGTSSFSANHLKKLILSGYKILAVLTQPDKVSGRGYNLTMSPVKIVASNYNIPILEPKTLLSPNLKTLITNFKADLMLVIAYGLILPKQILNIFPKGCINIHTSLLPKWRGAAPIQRAILAGDKQTGATAIFMNEKVDNGNIIYSLKCPINPNDTSLKLFKRIEKISFVCTFTTLKLISEGNVKTTIQDHCKYTYAKKIYKKEAKMNFSITSEILERSIRAFNPWPVSYFIMKKKQIKVWKANVIVSKIYKKYNIGEIIAINKKGLQINTSHNILNITQLQFPGKRIINAIDIFNSYKHFFAPGKKID